MCFPAEHSLPSACNQGFCSGGHAKLCYTACSADLTAPHALQASGIKAHMMQEEIKSKPIIQNGFICIPRERKQGDKNLVARSNEIVQFLTSFLKQFLALACCLFLSISFSVWMHSGHPYSAPQSLSGVVSICLRLACNDGLPRTRRSAGIYQATELRNLDKSDMCEHASVSVWFLCLFLHLWMLSLF